jgi:exosome complex exonuclease RRP6
MSTIDEVLLNSDSNDEFIRKMMSTVVLATKASNSIPSGNDYNYYATFPEFVESGNECSEGAARLIKEICAYVEPGKNIHLPDDLMDSVLYDHVVDVIDKLLENADLNMDKAAGKSKTAELSKSVQQSLSVDKERILISNVQEMPKPQLKFLTQIDNSRDTPFRPRLHTKYHQRAPLDLTERHDAVSDPDVVAATSYYAHPYETELKKLQYEKWQLSDPMSIEPKRPSPQQPLEMISDEDDMMRMIDELSREKEIAVDVEHHSFRSFQGITCLLQVTT